MHDKMTVQSHGHLNLGHALWGRWNVGQTENAKQMILPCQTSITPEHLHPSNNHM